MTDDHLRTGPPGDRLDVQVSFSVSTVDAVTVRKGLTAVTKPSREAAWRGPTRFAARIHETLAELHELVRASHPACVSLTEHAILCVDKALGQFSAADPDMDALRVEVRELHLAACHAVPPKPRRSQPGWSSWPRRPSATGCRTRPERYRDLLGDDGLAALDTILTRKLDAMPPDSQAALSHVGLTLRAMSESLARALGDIDRLVRELARDLTTPARYVRIAHELDAADRRDDALEWLQRGVTEHGAGDDALREALVIAYLHADHREDAIALLRAELTRAPSAQLTAELLAAAGEQRDAQRDWAHAQLTQAAERDGDAGELVTALLADGATAAALRPRRGSPCRCRSGSSWHGSPPSTISTPRSSTTGCSSPPSSRPRIARATAARSATCARCARPRRPTAAATRSSRSPAPRARSTRAAARSSRCSTSSAGGSRRRRCRLRNRLRGRAPQRNASYASCGAADRLMGSQPFGPRASLCLQ